LIEGQNTTATPWHNVVVEFENGSVRMMHKTFAVGLTGRVELVEKKGRFWHFRHSASPS